MTRPATNDAVSAVTAPSNRDAPSWGPFVSAPAPGTVRGSREPLRAPREDLYALGARLSPEAALGFAWHLAAALAELHERGLAHGMLDPSSTGLDADGRLVIFPYAGREIVPDPDPAAGAQARDCWQLGPCLDALGLHRLEEPGVLLLQSGLRRARGKLRLQPGRSARQALTALVARRPEAEEALVEALGPGWRLEPRPLAWFPQDAWERRWVPGPSPFPVPTFRGVAPISAASPKRSPPPPRDLPAFDAPDPPPRHVPYTPIPSSSQPVASAATSGGSVGLRVQTLRTRPALAADPDLADLVEVVPALVLEPEPADLTLAEPELELELGPLEGPALQFHPEDAPKEAEEEEEEELVDEPGPALVDEPELEPEPARGQDDEAPDEQDDEAPDDEPTTDEEASLAQVTVSPREEAVLVEPAAPELELEAEPEPVHEPVHEPVDEPVDEPVHEPELAEDPDEDVEDLDTEGSGELAQGEASSTIPLAPTGREQAPEPILLDREEADAAPRWGEARGVGQRAGRDAELGMGKWTEAARPLGEVARALPTDTPRPLDLEPDARGVPSLVWVAIAVAVVIVLGVVLL